MNIGIDFNTKNTRAAVFDKHKSVDVDKIFEVKNIFAFANENIYVGSDAVNKFITEKDASIYDLGQIVELNGLIINKRQVSIEKCLSIIFSHLLKKINKYFEDVNVDCVCVSIPYDKFYLWRELIPEAFSLVGIEKVRVISQPAAFFANNEIKEKHNKLLKKYHSEQYNNSHVQDEAMKAYEDTVWYKKILSQKPKRDYIVETGYLFVSTSADNSNISLINYGANPFGDLSYVVCTKYTEIITENLISKLVFQHIVGEVDKINEGFMLSDKKTLVRLQEAIDTVLQLASDNQYYELNVPYVLCKDGQYKNLDINIDLKSLQEFLIPTMDELIKIILKSAEETQEVQKDNKYRIKIGNIIIAGSPLIQRLLQKSLSEKFTDSQIILSSHSSLAIGSVNFSKMLTGENTKFLALEVVPFSISIRMRGSQFVEMIKKDTIVPTMSKYHCFLISGSGKSKLIEVQLTTTEGQGIQSLSVWKVKIEHWKAFVVAISIDANMKISLDAYPQDNSKPFDQQRFSNRVMQGLVDKNPIPKLEVRKGSTFSFNGSGFEMGIKGKDLQHYILSQFNYLNTVFSKKEFSVFEPSDQFYSYLELGDPLSALRDLGVALKLKGLPDIELSTSAMFEEHGIAGFMSGKKISIPQSFKKDPYGFGYVLAHELAHYILIHEEGITLDNEQENEILTEMFVIYCGMGKLFLNGFNTGGNEYTKGSRGYLDDKIINYIHQIYFEKFNINVDTYKRNLTKIGRDAIEQG